MSPRSKDQIDLSLGKPLECLVRALVQVLRLEPLIQREPVGSSSQ